MNSEYFADQSSPRSVEGNIRLREKPEEEEEDEEERDNQKDGDGDEIEDGYSE